MTAFRPALLCGECGASLTDVRALSDHEADKHGELLVPKFVCPCGKSFNSYSGLRVHQGYMRHPAEVGTR